MNPHPTAISTQLCQFCSFILMKHLFLLSITTHTAAVRLNLIMDGKRTSRLSLPEYTERMRKTMMTPLNHTILNQEQENMCGTIWLLLCLLQTSVCLLSMRTTTCKTITQSKKNTSHVVSIPFLAKFHLICLQLHTNFCYSFITFVV